MYLRKSAKFECDSLKPQWFHLGRNHLRMMEHNSTTIFKRKVGLKDGGIYFCYGFDPALRKWFIARAQLRIYGMFR